MSQDKANNKAMSAGETPQAQAAEKPCKSKKKFSRRRMVVALFVFLAVMGLVSLVAYVFMGRLIREEESKESLDFKPIDIETPIINETVKETDDSWFLSAVDETAKAVTQKTPEAENAAKKEAPKAEAQQAGAASRPSESIGEGGGTAQSGSNDQSGEKPNVSSGNEAPATAPSAPVSAPASTEPAKPAAAEKPATSAPAAPAAQ